MLAMECGWHLTAGEGEGGRGTQKTHKSGHLWKSRPSLPVPKPPQLVLLREGVEVGSGAWHVNMQGPSLSVRQPWRALGRRSESGCAGKDDGANVLQKGPKRSDAKGRACENFPFVVGRAIMRCTELAGWDGSRKRKWRREELRGGIKSWKQVSVRSSCSSGRPWQQAPRSQLPERAPRQRRWARTREWGTWLGCQQEVLTVARL